MAEGRVSRPSGRRAVFLDRDGTIIEDTGYLHEAEKVRLLPGAGQAIRRLNLAGWLVVTATNQSGIARGLYDVAAYEAAQRRLAELLAVHGARLDGAYYCPHHPQVTGPCTCRKPGTKLYTDARDALGIALAPSLWIGDRLSDVQPALRLGGQAFLVTSGDGNLYQGRARALGVTVVRDLAHAVDEILGAG